MSRYYIISCFKGTCIIIVFGDKVLEEEVESRALITFTGSATSHWFRYVDDTWVKIKAREVETFTEQGTMTSSLHGEMSEESQSALLGLYSTH